ncbi:MAG: PQQ-binding-like beta-propeller repeat protein, partial [Pseudomonadales bacterium]|nr:PQQ-binding-like beta-propeller repeat protein [Pseudomonadales bacterium]
RRGVSYWQGDRGISPRIFYTAGSRLVALDAATGAVDRNFGEGGVVSMGTPYLSVPLVYKNVIVVGANTPPGQPGGIGNPRAYSAINGNQLWEFSSVPQPGQVGHETWDGDSWVGRLGANAWPFYFTVDTERDLLFLPLASPIPFAYGGDRAGDNLFANALVAVNVNSGEYVWHFQTIHHDLWDHDPPAPPTLFEINRQGESIPALAVTTKSGYLFILNRETGTPIYEVEEKAVAQSTVPGESSAATQPIPSTTPAMARVSFSIEELATADQTSAEHVAACQQLLSDIGEIENLGPYTPWSYRPDASTGSTTLLFPGLGGGPNWGGVAFDPNSQLGFVFAGDVGTFGWMQDAEPGADLPYVRSGPRPGSFLVNINGTGMPCQQPPWSHLSAVDMTTGELAWRIPLGITEALPAGNQNTGRPGRASAVVTATDLLFIAATDDNRFRALRTSTGETLWETRLEKRGNANPMTYLGSDDNQYVAISATDELVVFSLPN